MKLAIVRGPVVATEKHPAYRGARVMLCELAAPDWSPSGAEVIAIDRVSSGPGDRVLIMHEGNSTRQILGPEAGPILDLIVAIVDHVEMQ